MVVMGGMSVHHAVSLLLLLLLLLCAGCEWSSYRLSARQPWRVGGFDV